MPMNLRLALDEQTFCDLLGGQMIRLSASVGRTGFTRGEEQLVLELCLAESMDGLRAALMTVIAAKTEEKPHD
jgi:hypothetical protein